MKKILGRILIVVPAIALQIGFYILVLMLLDSVLGGNLGDIISVAFTVLAVIFVTYLVAKRDESSYKLIWVVLIMAFPVFGALLYFFVGNKKTGIGLKKRLDAANAMFDLPDYKDGDKHLAEIRKDDLRLGQTVEHLSRSTGFPALKFDSSRYYRFGEEMFADMCEDLKKAEKFIYVEYFIIQSGKFWDTMTDIMAEKAAKGVDVRVMYDDLGSIGTYSATDVARLAKKGIKCIPFNPFFLIDSQLNNRDHRKIMVIDGKVAYSGGVNIADEYINAIEKFGRWKDTGFRITGDGVMSYTYMFAQFWNAFSEDKINTSGLFTFPDKPRRLHSGANGYIIPYYDSPMREEHTSNELFTEILSAATDHVWFFTPYLILGDALFDALIRAAKRGVDVRIIMPGIPDKKMVFRLSRSYYEDLLKAGVRIFEYKPGFVHAKSFLADDKIGAIGTVNLDYRSLFLHFECNAIFYKSEILKDLKQDYVDTFKECAERTLADVEKGILFTADNKPVKWVAFNKLINNILRLIAPLL